MFTGCAGNTASAPAEPIPATEAEPEFPVDFKHLENTSGDAIYGLPEQDISAYPVLTEMLEGGSTAVCAELLTPSEA